MIAIVLGNEEITDDIDSLQWSTTDPGGFESCTFTLPNQRAGDHLGETVTIYEGLDVVFQGRINEPGNDYSQQMGTQQFTAVGDRAVLSDNQASMVFIDRAVGSWTPPSLSRTVGLDTSWVVNQFEQQVDTTNGAPGLKLDTTGGVKGTSGILCEAWYDAGLGNLIHQLILQSGVSATANSLQVTSASDDIATTTEVLQAGTAVAVAETLYTLTTDRRYLCLQGFNAAVSTTPRFRTVFKLAVIGNHSLTLQGSSTARGYYPGDVAQWAATQVGGFNFVIGTDPNTYIVPHLVYKTPVSYEQMITDMANLLGWHWGVWEPCGLTTATPTLYFTPPPASATAYVASTDVTGLNLSQQLSEMYNRVRVAYTDVAGVPAYTTVTRNVSRLGSLTRTADVTLGVSSLSVAQQFGADYLALLESSGRAVGQCTLPPYVGSTSGLKWAHLLKPGRDRLKIVGLQDTTAGIIDPDSKRFDTFRISRLSTTQNSDGTLQTTAELDAGANLLDVLNARLAIAAQLGGG